jgi:hypothetical protein
MLERPPLASDTAPSPPNRSSRPDANTLRRLAVKYGVDPRSIRREWDEARSVRGMAGERARDAVAELRATPERAAR